MIEKLLRFLLVNALMLMASLLVTSFFLMKAWEWFIFPHIAFDLTYVQAIGVKFVQLISFSQSPTDIKEPEELDIVKKDTFGKTIGIDWDKVSDQRKKAWKKGYRNLGATIFIFVIAYAFHLVIG